MQLKLQYFSAANILIKSMSQILHHVSQKNDSSGIGNKNQLIFVWKLNIDFLI